MFKSQKNTLKFAKSKADTVNGSWKVMIVDDEEGVHSITKTVLSNIVFENKKLEFISAYSAAEAKEQLHKHPDTALILLDVVMEEDNSGLVFAKYVREELKNKIVRIVLRTGQPGQAPEREVIIAYDINDYKEKTELTANKLFTTIIASIRNYRDLTAIENKKRIIEQNRVGLRQIINSSANLFEMHSLKEFASGVLMQLMSILKVNKASLCSNAQGFTAITKATGECCVIAGTGPYESYVDTCVLDMGEEVQKYIDLALKEQQSIYEDDVFVGYYKTHNERENIIFMHGCKNITEDDRQLIEIFSSNVSIAFDNIYLDKEVLDTQVEVINTLGEVVESRSKETANHVKRVAEFSYLLAKKFGLKEEEAQTIKYASPMHDIGKIGIPDSILLKPGRLEGEEIEIMKTHASIGYEILKKSKRPILQAAAIIAGQHHEKYNGKGYPEGLAGEDIHLYGRIVAIVDVFDALTHKRCYKEAWSLEETVDFMQSQRGKHFDPHLLDLFFSDIDQLVDINTRFLD